MQTLGMLLKENNGGPLVPGDLVSNAPFELNIKDQ